MRLYRMCSPQEIEAIKADSPLKLTFGGPLFKYIHNVGEYNNRYAYYNQFWEEFRHALRGEKLKPILKYFKDIPQNIPLFCGTLKQRKEALNNFMPNEMNWNFLPEQLKFTLTSQDQDYTFLGTIKLAGFFDDLRNYRENLGFFRDPLFKNPIGNIIVVDVPNEIAMKHKGKGEYGFAKPLVEYAIPMYKIKPENVVATYDLGSEKGRL